MIKIKEIERRCVVLGFGGVAKPVCHIFSTRYPMKEYLLIDKRKIDDEELKLFGNKKVTRLEIDIEPENLFDTILNIVKDGDIVFDFFGCNETLDIIRACNQKKDIFYINSSLEENILKPYPTQNALYDAFEEFKKKYNPTINGCIDAGANPGMITHFSILGLFSMAKYAIENKTPDSKEIETLLNKKDLGKLAEILKIDVIHISEIEEIEPSDLSKLNGYITNSWCINSFHDEWNTNGEIIVGTHDKKYLSKNEYKKIPLSNPPSVKCPFPLYMKTASPQKIFTGKVVSHPEILEISKLFSTESHIPTVAFVYHPSRLPRQNLEEKNWKSLPPKIFDESNSGPLSGSETMGATLISSRDDIPPRWFGSIVTCEQEREIGANSNPTVLQVAAGITSHLIISLENPGKGLCMPHDFDSEKILEIAKPFLGTIVDMNLPFRLPTNWEELLSTKEQMDSDLIL
jgi:homospermidine synthase